ncbi:DoxX family membrane protein [Propionibacterium australiense]|uniref:DoxX family membrane protein n=1 Tax=Propionibacterium australiense TaxID=119981 RepID=A0A8B3GG11_9ACTN|nr:DoxX family membrane protein [Propionibacterium australiense]RLP10176.1 DoxX family membrane protein [Propionibacterium australiense]
MQRISSERTKPVSDQNEGLYDSVSTPTDQPHQSVGATHEANAAVAGGFGEPRGAARAAEDEETAALDELDEIVADEPQPAEEADATQVLGLPEEDEAEQTALLAPPTVDRTVSLDLPAADRTVSLDLPAAEEDDAPGQAETGGDEAATEETGKAASEASERAAREAEVRAQQAEAAARARQKAERDRRLGTVAPAAAPAAAATATAKPPAKRTTDKFAGSLGLLFLRVVAAATVGALGFQIVTESGPVIKALQGIGVPQADMVSMGVGVLGLAIAVMLLFGLGTRIAAALLVALTGATLAFFRWGRFNPFVAGQAGFSGDIEFLLAGIGLCFLFLGAGGWSIDGGLRRSRARKKARARAKV